MRGQIMYPPEPHDLIRFDDTVVTCPIRGCNVVSSRGAISWSRRGKKIIGILPSRAWKNEKLRRLRAAHRKGIHTHPTQFQAYGLAYKFTIPKVGGSHDPTTRPQR